MKFVYWLNSAKLTGYFGDNMPISQKELANQNPWWQNKAAILDDYKIKQFDNSKIQYLHPLTGEKYQPFSLFIVRGPRQVRKSTAVKILIRKLLSEGANPYSIFFFDCEMLFTASEIKEAVEAYFNFTDLMQYADVNYLLLDEITSVTDWAKIIKFLVDSGRFQKSVVFLTGSNAIDLQKGADRLPGRKGAATELLMLPLSFREFVKLMDAALYEKIADLSFEPISMPAIYKASASLLPHSEKLSQLMISYLVCGDFAIQIDFLKTVLTVSFIFRTDSNYTFRNIHEHIRLASLSRNRY
jgi:predicted AAA+ superfamily ATPase